MNFQHTSVYCHTLSDSNKNCCSILHPSLSPAEKNSFLLQSLQIGWARWTFHLFHWLFLCPVFSCSVLSPGCRLVWCFSRQRFGLCGSDVSILSLTSAVCRVLCSASRGPVQSAARTWLPCCLCFKSPECCRRRCCSQRSSCTQFLFLCYYIYFSFLLACAACPHINL